MINFNEVIPNADKGTRKFLNKFNEFTIQKANSDKIIFTNGITVSYSIDVSSTGLSSLVTYPDNKYAMPIQVVIRVTMNGVYASTWGSGSQHDNNLILIWFQLKHNEGRDSELKNEKIVHAEYENLMNEVRSM